MDEEDIKRGGSGSCSGILKKPITRIYKEVTHINDAMYCIYTPEKGLIKFLMNKDDVTSEISQMQSLRDALSKTHKVSDVTENSEQVLKALERILLKFVGEKGNNEGGVELVERLTNELQWLREKDKLHTKLLEMEILIMNMEKIKDERDAFRETENNKKICEISELKTQLSDLTTKKKKTKPQKIG
jgi:hypothetical protein